MKQRLRHIAALLTITCMLCACSGDSYPGVEYEYETSGEATNLEEAKATALGSKLRLFINEQSFFSGSSLNETRGTGPFVVPDTTLADKNHYSKSVFRIFAFRDRPDNQGPLDYTPDYTMRAGDLNDGNKNCLVDGGSEYTQGLKVHLKSDHTGELALMTNNFKYDSILHYSEHYADIGYNFFAYHIDDVAINHAQRESDRIYYDIDFDGTQDIMTGFSKRLTAKTLAERHGLVELTPEERYKVLNIGNYSSYSSMLNIHPIIDMHRELTRLEFRAYPANTSCNDVYIDEVGVYTRHKARLTVAAKDSSEIGIQFDEQRDTLWLKGRDKTKTNPDSIGIYPLVPLASTNNTVNWKEGMDTKNWANNQYTIVGNDMLVAPDSVYTLVIRYHQDTNRGIMRFENQFRLTAPHIEKNFVRATEKWIYKPGLKYIIRIAIYGLAKVGIEATLDIINDEDDIEVDLEKMGLQ